jgi:hypothetical protein
VPEEPSIAGVALAAARKGKGARESSQREREISAVGYCRASPAIAHAREEAPKLPLRIAQNAAPRYFFPVRAIMQPLLEEDTARAGGKKAVILALRYFSAAAGDALSNDN